MSAQTSIEWTERTWNPVRGCARVSPGCEHCYAERVAHRFSKLVNGKPGPYHGLTVLGKKGPRWSGEARFIPEALGEPLRWRKGQRVFVNSMSDLFHEGVSFEQIAAVFGVMAAAPRHTFQILTKRPERALEFFRWLQRAGLDYLQPGETRLCVAWAQHETRRSIDALDDRPTPSWPLPNVWLGVSCEDQARADERIPLLLQCPAAVRFVSAEPLLGPLDLQRYVYDLSTSYETRGVDWVIVGGESGPGARPCQVEWIEGIVRQCADASVACFVKQLGARPSEAEPPNDDGSRAGAFEHKLRDRKGGDISEWPARLRVRQFPKAA